VSNINLNLVIGITLATLNAHAVYIVNKGVPYPHISTDDEPTIYELDTMTCNDPLMSGCKNY